MSAAAFRQQALRQLGNSGLTVSTVGLGCNNLGKPGTASESLEGATALIDAALMLPQGAATGTGTDCIALAADPGRSGFAGLHTPLGEALGRAVYDAVSRGAANWLRQHRPPPARAPAAGETGN